MKLKILGIGILLVVGVLFLKGDLPMTRASVIGTYFNTNYENERCCVASPHRPDTLILKEDGTFSSDYYGNGTYEVSYGFLSTEIDWTYDYEIGKGYYSTQFSNKINERPRIMLNYDMNHYYEKME